MFSSTMGGGMPGRLVGAEIHGFHTVQDLDVEAMFIEARARWLRPNEIHAILCNHKLFPILVKPVNLPESGTIVLFDRKMLRNFRKDGHNWKKKKDGKTIKEAHEHLKIGNEERIHVYYAHGQDNPTFVRRCYWLLDKSLEHIVLVHYRQTQELQNSPVTPMNSNSSSLSEQLSPWTLSDELDSGAGQTHFSGEPSDTLTVKSHQMRLHELNTLEWDELVASESNIPEESSAEVSHHTIQKNQVSPSASTIYDSTSALYNSPTEVLSMRNSSELGVDSDFMHQQNSNLTLYNSPTGIPSNMNFGRKPDSFPGTGDSLDILAYDGLQNQNSFGRWMGNIISQSQGSSDGLGLESSISSSVDAFASTFTPLSSVPEHIFVISDVSPAWAFSTEKTKILVTGYFHDQYRHLAKSNLYCVCGDLWFPAEVVQDGVYRCFISPQSPGLVHLYLSLDKHKPISPILNFEYRAQLSNSHVHSSDDKSVWEEFGFQLRLVKLLLSTSKILNILTSKVSPVNVKEAQKLDANTSRNITNSWSYFTNSIEERRMSFEQAKDGLFELTLKNLLKEWLLERVVEGCKATEYDAFGLGVIHLCAVLGYTWAIRLFSWAGLSLDFRDKHGWTALHWASYYGREKMVAVLLSAGANPSRVTDPTPKNPGGCVAADLASANGYEGLAAYLSEKALVAHLKAMSIAGNASGSLETISEDIQIDNKNLTEEEVCLKDTLAAYRTAADAAARIQSAFREHSLKVRTQAVEYASPEAEARSIIAAMKIQHAFRNFDSRKKMAAAARIQYRFRTWKMRRDFLNLRRQAIKIQSYFRGFQVRRNYRKIIWSVGVLEKAVLRWRLKRKGFRGLQINENEATGDHKQESDAEEDFYKTSRKQAEERVERSVIQVQAMFRSKKAQQEYQRMKMAHNHATREYEDPFNTDTDMNS